jgi:hypothetical protein
MSICQTGDNGYHRWGYHKTMDGGDIYVCMNANCGETLIEYLDCFGG